jgi:DNA-binding PadR family transcriptional regulator
MDPEPATLSNAETALLGLLCEGAMHPWQIEKTVQDRDMRYWTDLSQSTIYKQLRALQKTGLVQCRQEVGDGRVRKVYSVTKTGREALAAKIRELLSEPEHLKWRVDLATYNLDLLPKKDALACLRKYRRKLEEGVACYGELDAFLTSCSCPAHRHAVARRPRYLLEGEILWVDDYIAGLKGR